MRTRSVTRLLAVAALGTPVCVASADVMTFSGLPSNFTNPDYTENAFRLTSTNGGFFFGYQPGWPSAGNPAPSVVGSYQGMIYHLAASNGGVFDFESMDIATYAGMASHTITVTGFLSGGGTVTRDISSSSSFQTWTTFTFDSNWNSVTAVEFVSSGLMFDNLVGSVPTPGAAALLGLGGLTAARRRR